jgi:drug/metabolite transporter (DMT)-like permease
MSGILLMITAFALFSVLDASAKQLMPYLPAGVVVLGRYVAGVTIIAIIGWLGWKRAMWRTAHPRIQLLRGLLMTLATLFNFVAVKYLQLAQTSAILFSAPLWVCALSPLMLGETVGWRRWAAVLAGFAGVMVVIRPGLGGFHPAMLLSLAAALTLALYQILTRKVGGRDAAISSLLWSNVWALIFSIPLLGAGAALPHGWQWGFLALAGLTGSLGHFLLTEAHRRADASLLAPFVYSQLGWMILIGWLWFSDIPDVWTLAGALIVAASGLFVYHRERAAARRNVLEELEEGI